MATMSASLSSTFAWINCRQIASSVKPTARATLKTSSPFAILSSVATSIPAQRKASSPRGRLRHRGLPPVIQSLALLRRMRFERLLVGFSAPAGRVGHHELPVLDLRHSGEQLVVPRQTVD